VPTFKSKGADNNPRAPFEIYKKEINDPETNPGQD
jgi:hypothetical protein